MTITVRDYAFSAQAAGTTFTFSLPTSVSSGDIIVALLTNKTDTSPTTVTPPSGWTHLGTDVYADVANYAVHKEVYYKTATGSEGGTTDTIEWSDGGDGFFGMVFAIYTSGSWHSTAPIAEVAYGSFTSPASTLQATAVTLANTGTCIHGLFTGDNNTITFDTANGWTIEGSGGDNAATDGSWAFASQTFSTTGSKAHPIWSLDANEYGAYTTILFREAGAETFYKTLTPTAVGTSSLGPKNVAVSKSYSGIGTSGLLKKVSKILNTATGVGTSALTYRGVTQLALTTFSAVGTASLTFTTAFKRTLQSTAVGTASLVKKVGKGLAATAIGTASLVASQVSQAGFRNWFPGWMYPLGSETGPETFYKTLTPSATGTASRLAHVGKLVDTHTGTGTSSLTKTAGKALAASGVGSAVLTTSTNLYRTLTYTAIGTANLLKKAGVLLESTGTGTASMTWKQVVQQLLTYTAVGTAALTRQVSYLRTLTYSAVGTASLAFAQTLSKTLTYTAIGTTALTKKAGKLLQATGVGTAVLTYQAVQKVLLDTFSAIGTATLTKSVGSVRRVTAIGTATLSRSGSFYRTLQATAVGTASLAKKTVLGAFASTATGTATLARKVGVLLESTVTGNVTLVKAMVKSAMSFTATGTAGLTKKVGKLLDTATAIGTATLLVGSQVFYVTLYPVAVGTVSLSKAVAKGLKTAAATGTASLQHVISYLLNLSYTATGAATLTSKAIYAKILSYTGTGQAVLTKLVRKTLSSGATGASSLAKGISKAFNYAASGTVVAVQSLRTKVTAFFNAVGTSDLQTQYIPFSIGAAIGTIRRMFYSFLRRR